MFLSSGAKQPNPEVPERADLLLEASRTSGLKQETPHDYGLAPAAGVHTPEYLIFLQTIHDRWQKIEGASEEVIPNIHPNGRGGAYPASAVGHAGYHMADTSCPISAETWISALRSAHAATHAAELVSQGAAAAYALCRPPGLMLSPTWQAVFATSTILQSLQNHLLRHGSRVAILDVDLHHGNGTQGYSMPAMMCSPYPSMPTQSAFIHSSGAMPTSGAKTAVSDTI